jgi:hypothetical protein
MPDKKMDYKRRHQANIKGETKRNIMQGCKKWGVTE